MGAELPPQMHLGMPRAVPQVSAPGGQDWFFLVLGKPRRFHQGTGGRFSRQGRSPRGWGGLVTPPRYLRAVRGPGDAGWQRGRGNGSTISFHKLKLVLIS